MRRMMMMRINIEEDSNVYNARTIASLIRDIDNLTMPIHYYQLQKKIGNDWSTVQVYPTMRDLDFDTSEYKLVLKQEQITLAVNTIPVVYYQNRYTLLNQDDFVNYIMDYYNLNSESIARMYLAQRYHYDPLANYDRREYFNEKVTDAYGHTIETAYDSDVSTVNGLQTTVTETGKEKDNVKEYVTGYNSPSTETLNSHTEDIRDFENRQSKSVNSGTDTVTKNGKDTDTHGGTDTETKTSDNHFIGNIGVTMTQDMIERELSLGARNILSEIFYASIKDISFVI